MVAKITTRRMRSVTLMIRVLYRRSIAANTAIVAPAAWTTMPSHSSSYALEMAPTKKPCAR